MRFLTVITVLFMSQGLFADGHGHSEPSFEGLISSEIFDLDGKMDMHVERRESCGGDTPKHFHPATGTLVYVLDGKSQSKSTGNWKTYSNNQYWFEKSDWVHGGDDATPEMDDGCSDLLVIRVAESGQDHTVFIE